jgi:YidC/Oxa1 family membrane protein insertase
MYYQMKPTMTNPEMKAMLWIMPVMMFAFSGMMPSGLVLYWTVSNVFGIFQYKVLGTTSVPGA